MKITKLLLTICLLIIAVLPVQAKKKYLPVIINGSGSAISYTYDDLNRFTLIKATIGETVRIDSIIYDADDMGYTIISYTQFPDGTQFDFGNKSQSVRFKNKSASTISFDVESTEYTYTFTSSGRIKKIVMKDNNRSNSDDNAAIINYKYDDRGNFIGVDLPNNASGDRINRSIQALEYMNYTYDKKNGIFKDINPACFTQIYSLDTYLPFFFFLENNLLKMNEKSGNDEDSASNQYEYGYNTSDYPEKIKLGGDDTFHISYIEAK